MFSEHGLYEVHCDGTIIIFVATGAWNLEASRTAISAISDCVDKLAGREFAIIADTREVEGITPDSTEAWSEAITEWLDKGYSTFARVDEPDSVYYQVYLSGLDELALKNQEVGMFDSLPVALDWLHQEGFSGFADGPPEIKLTAKEPRRQK